MDICWEDAVRRGNADIMRDLLSRGIDPNACDRHGQTGLMLAAHAGHLAVVQFLIDHGVDLNVTTKFGLSAVMLAVLTIRRSHKHSLALARI